MGGVDGRIRVVRLGLHGREEGHDRGDTLAALDRILCAWTIPWVLDINVLGFFCGSQVIHSLHLCCDGGLRLGHRRKTISTFTPWPRSPLIFHRAWHMQFTQS